MSFVNLVFKIFHTPSPQDTVLQSQTVPVERNIDPEVQKQAFENRNSAPRQDKVSELLSITWMGWRNV